MKSASAATINILNTASRIFRIDLFTIITPDGTTLRWSGSDRAIPISPNTFELGPLVERSTTRQKVGIEVDSITLTVKDNKGYLYKGRPIIRAISEGEFDGALVQVDKMFLSDIDDLSPGIVPWFTGYVSKPDVSTGVAELTVKSMLGLLDRPMPRNLYMPPCNNTFGDAACGKSKGGLTLAATVTGSPTAKQFTITGPAAGSANGYYDLGVIVVNDGPLAGLSRTVRSYSGGVVQVTPAFPSAIPAGTSVSLYPSCLKSTAACTAHANIGKFRGFPFVPAPETLYGGGTSTPSTASQGGTGVAPSGSYGGGRATQTYLQ